MLFSSSSRTCIDSANPSQKVLWWFIITLVVKSMVCNGFCLIGNPTWKGKPIITVFNENERTTNSTNNMKGKIERIISSFDNGFYKKVIVTCFKIHN